MMSSIPWFYPMPLYHVEHHWFELARGHKKTAIKRHQTRFAQRRRQSACAGGRRAHLVGRGREVGWRASSPLPHARRACEVRRVLKGTERAGEGGGRQRTRSSSGTTNCAKGLPSSPTSAEARAVCDPANPDLRRSHVVRSCHRLRPQRPRPIAGTCTQWTAAAALLPPPPPLLRRMSRTTGTAQNRRRAAMKETTTA